jgi:hypothetical protein
MVDKRVIRVSDDMIRELDRIREKYQKEGVRVDNPASTRMLVRELQQLREKNNQKKVNPWDMGMSKK